MTDTKLIKKAYVSSISWLKLMQEISRLNCNTDHVEKYQSVIDELTPQPDNDELVEEMWLSILSGVESDDDIHFDEKFLKAEISKLLQHRQLVQVDEELAEKITSILLRHKIDISRGIQAEIRKLLHQSKPKITRGEIESFVYQLNQLPMSAQGRELEDIFKSKGFEITDEVVG